MSASVSGNADASVSAVDSHVHVWTRSTDPQPWIDPGTMAAIDRDFGAAEVRAMLQRTGASQAVLVQASDSAAETGRLLQLAADTVEIAGVVGWLDLTADVAAQLDSLPGGLRGELVGVRHLVHLDPDERWLARTDVTLGLADLADAGLPFDLVVRWWQLPLATRTAAEHPELVFVLDHLGGVPAEREHQAAWEEGLRALAAQPNTVAKLSGISALSMASDGGTSVDAVVSAAFDAFGPERLMYGSDWPLAELAAGAEGWRRAVDDRLSSRTPDERRAVLHGTARRVYRLEAR